MNVPGWNGIDYTTDPFLLGKDDPSKSALAYNYRAKKGIRECRFGHTPIIDFANGNPFRKSGVYFPPESYAVLPHTKDSYNDTFYAAGATEFTLEFWFRAEYQAYDRTLCCIPMDFGSSIENHMCMKLIPRVGDDFRNTLIYFYMIMEDPETTGSIAQMPYWPTSTLVDLNGEWHHIAIYRYAGMDDCGYRLDGGDEVTMTLNSVNTGYDIVRDTTIKELHETPHMYNYLKVGCDDVSMAEFRIWTKRRTAEEIAATMNTELDGDEDGLACYLPFNEGTGKHFTDQVHGARGYFVPQEPYVNDDYELVFTGHKCMAYPSLRAYWILPTGEDNQATHKLGNEEAAYDGGILWDTVLQYGAAKDLSIEGPFEGTAQLRIRLRQLKEGILCGRLGMLYDYTEEKYRLFFFNEEGATVYTSDAVIDEDWIGVEKTITVIYQGDSDNDPDTICSFYIDDGENISEATPSATWGNDAGDDVLTTTAYLPFQDNEGLNGTYGALGGSVLLPEMCIAFDLIFFRQWYDAFPGSTVEEFITTTYDKEILDDSYKYVVKEFSGWIQRGENYIVTSEDIEIFDPSWGVVPPMSYIRMPLHHETSTFDMDDGNSYIIINNDPDTGDVSVPKQTVMVKRIYNYLVSSGWERRLAILYGNYSYGFGDGGSASWGDRVYFNGASLSSLVNHYNHETFKKNRLQRAILYATESESGEPVSIVRDYEIQNTITDDSPLQSVIGNLGLTTTRYLILTTDDHHNVITNQVSLQPRWCDGPVPPNTLPLIRGIYRYTSEDKEINKLIVVAWNSAWEVDPATGEVTAQKWGWLDKNDEKLVNFLAVNNRLLITDGLSAIKLNHRGNWSRLGVEVPNEVAIAPGDDVPGGVFVQGGWYAWVAQFYDSENDAYSGTIPVFGGQGLQCSNESAGISYVIVAVRSCKDYNVDHCIIYRTQDYSVEGEGSLSDFYRINNTGNNRFLGTWTRYNDIWLDSNLTNNPRLSEKYLSKTLTPPAAKGISVGYNRVFMLNSTEEKSSLFWSDVDALGFAKPDQFPSTYKMIIEEGDTTEGTALIEFSSQVFVFKENAIFLIEQISPANFANRLIYKGVGAVNQRSVLVAGNALVFIDRSGIHRYAGGEPEMLSVGLVDYFRDEIDQTEIVDKAFMLFNKTDSIIYSFLPSAGSEHCDRVVVYDMRKKVFSLDMIPPVTCGYVDDDEIYLGTPYGQIYKVSKTNYLDGVTVDYSGTGVIV